MILADIGTVTEAFATAALDSSRWVAALDLVSEAAGAVGALLFPLKGKLPTMPYSPSMAPTFETYIQDGWYRRDERYRGTPLIARQGVATDLDIMSAEEIAVHPYYQEFLAPSGLYGWAGVKFACADDFWILSIQRTIDQGPFTIAEQKRLADLSTRLTSAAALARALSFARADAAMAATQKTYHPSVTMGSKAK